jgi:hypothetical protein
MLKFIIGIVAITQLINAQPQRANPPTYNWNGLSASELSQTSNQAGFYIKEYGNEVDKPLKQLITSQNDFISPQKNEIADGSDEHRSQDNVVRIPNRSKSGVGVDGGYDYIYYENLEDLYFIFDFRIDKEGQRLTIPSQVKMELRMHSKVPLSNNNNFSESFFNTIRTSTDKTIDRTFLNDLLGTKPLEIVPYYAGFLNVSFPPFREYILVDDNHLENNPDNISAFHFPEAIHENFRYQKEFMMEILYKIDGNSNNDIRKNFALIQTNDVGIYSDNELSFNEKIQVNPPLDSRKGKIIRENNKLEDNPIVSTNEDRVIVGFSDEVGGIPLLATSQRVFKTDLEGNQEFDYYPFEHSYRPKLRLTCTFNNATCRGKVKGYAPNLITNNYSSPILSPLHTQSLTTDEQISNFAGMGFFLLEDTGRYVFEVTGANGIKRVLTVNLNKDNNKINILNDEGNPITIADDQEFDSQITFSGNTFFQNEFVPLTIKYRFDGKSEEVVLNQESPSWNAALPGNYILDSVESTFGTTITQVNDSIEATVFPISFTISEFNAPIVSFRTKISGNSINNLQESPDTVVMTVSTQNQLRLLVNKDGNELPAEDISRQNAFIKEFSDIGSYTIRIQIIANGNPIRDHLFNDQSTFSFIISQPSISEVTLLNRFLNRVEDTIVATTDTIFSSPNGFFLRFRNNFPFEIHLEDENSQKLESIAVTTANFALRTEEINRPGQYRLRMVNINGETVMFENRLQYLNLEVNPPSIPSIQVINARTTQNLENNQSVNIGGSLENQGVSIVYIADQATSIHITFNGIQLFPISKEASQTKITHTFKDPGTYSIYVLNRLNDRATFVSGLTTFNFTIVNIPQPSNIELFSLSNEQLITVDNYATDSIVELRYTHPIQNRILITKDDIVKAPVQQASGGVSYQFQETGSYTISVVDEFDQTGLFSANGNNTFSFSIIPVENQSSFTRRYESTWFWFQGAAYLSTDSIKDHIISNPSFEVSEGTDTFSNIQRRFIPDGTVDQSQYTALQQLSYFTFKIPGDSQATYFLSEQNRSEAIDRYIDREDVTMKENVFTRPENAPETNDFYMLNFSLKRYNNIMVTIYDLKNNLSVMLDQLITENYDFSKIDKINNEEGILAQGHYKIDLSYPSGKQVSFTVQTYLTQTKQDITLIENVDGTSVNIASLEEGFNDTAYENVESIDFSLFDKYAFIEIKQDNVIEQSGYLSEFIGNQNRFVMANQLPQGNYKFSVRYFDHAREAMREVTFSVNHITSEPQVEFTADTLGRLLKIEIKSNGVTLNQVSIKLKGEVLSKDSLDKTIMNSSQTYTFYQAGDYDVNIVYSGSKQVNEFQKFNLNFPSIKIVIDGNEDNANPLNISQDQNLPISSYKFDKVSISTEAPRVNIIVKKDGVTSPMRELDFSGVDFKDEGTYQITIDAGSELLEYLNFTIDRTINDPIIKINGSTLGQSNNNQFSMNVNQILTMEFDELMTVNVALKENGQFISHPSGSQSSTQLLNFEQILMGKNPQILEVKVSFVDSAGNEKEITYTITLKAASDTGENKPFTVNPFTIFGIVLLLVVLVLLVLKMLKII